MADSNKLKRTDAQMPTTKEFERYPGKKRREEGDDDVTAGENPPHAGVGEPPAGEAGTRLGDAFAIAARLAPAAQHTQTVGMVPMEPETTKAPAGGASGSEARQS